MGTLCSRRVSRRPLHAFLPGPLLCLPVMCQGRGSRVSVPTNIRLATGLPCFHTPPPKKNGLVMFSQEIPSLS